MKKMMAAWTATVMVLALAGSLLAHHSLAQFDTTRAVKVRGVIVLFERVNPHSILFVDQKGESGQIQRWAVDGPSIIQLKRMGIDVEALKVGAVVEACGYVTKEGVDSQRTVFTEPIDLSLKATAPKSVTGRRLQGELLVMPDGRNQVWSDYGQHKCLGPDYHDHHAN